jgi:cation transport ATPase
VDSGLPAGAALVFLMAGPATNVATIGAVYRALGRRMLAIYLAAVIVGSVVSGMLFGFVLDSHPTSHDAMHHGSPWWAVVSAVVLAVLLLWFAWQDGVGWLRRRNAAGANAIGAIEVDVEGMTCGNCTAKLERQLVADQQVDAAIVTLNPGRAQVRGAISAERVRKLVRQAGFIAPPPRDSTKSRQN